MPDIIQLLPEHVANQIAAGEVVQRPASVVKELIENAVDAGALAIKVIIKEAGKTLIQVNDNGRGMTSADARLSFMRHATSKIRKAEDIFNILSMGFRGEALPSIGAVAHVCMKTRHEDQEIGSEIDFEGGELISQKAYSGSAGTSISVKNLFFNIPARRAFLKSNNIEFRHISDEFQRQGLAHPEIFFSLSHDGNELYHLPSSALRQRIIHLFGNPYSERLIPVEESTGIMELKGYVGKPEFARKTRGEQFFFINGRYFREPYFHHAVMKAYEEMLPAESLPFYCICLSIPTDKIDINVHPSKTEIKFEDEKHLYAILRAAVKRALGKYIISPSIDFDAETGFSELGILPVSQIIQPVIRVNPNFNPFLTEGRKTAEAWGNAMQSGNAIRGSNAEPGRNVVPGGSTVPGRNVVPGGSTLPGGNTETDENAKQDGNAETDENAEQGGNAVPGGNSEKLENENSGGRADASTFEPPAYLNYEAYASDPEAWKKRYNISQVKPEENQIFEEAEQDLTLLAPKDTFTERAAFQIHLKYLVTSIKSGMLIIDQQAAHERVLYENYLEMMDQQTVFSQQTLFPQTITLSPADNALVSELVEEIRLLGFEIRAFGGNTWVLEGIPAGLPSGNEQGIIEVLLENYKQNHNLHKLEKRDNLARSLARKAGLKGGRKLDSREINLLIDQLFACRMPSVSPSGKPVFITLGLDELLKKFEK